ncbi:MAG: peptidoglycan recognition family protein [Candidatus Paceibacterota bacterium]
MKYSLMIGLMSGLVFGVFASVAQAEMVERKETTMIVVHHTGENHGEVSSIRAGHVQDRGWDDIGYHYLICNGDGGNKNPPVQDGEVQRGRPEHLQGAHAGRYGLNRNPVSVGVVLVGKDKYTRKQKVSLVATLVRLCYAYNIEPSAETIQTHHEDCPGDGLNMEEIINATVVVLRDFRDLPEKERWDDLPK